MPEITEFKLKRFFHQPLASTAKASLSSSLAEVCSLQDVLPLEPGAEQAYTQLGLGYTQPNGSLELRTLIAARYQSLTPDDIVVTSGSDDAFVVLFSALLDAGDHAVVQSPAYQPLISLAQWRGATVSPWPCREEHAWQPPIDHIQDLLSRQPRILVINTPHNPTGYAFNRGDLQAICDIAQARHTIVVSDEVYRDLPLTETPCAPPAADLSHTAVSIGSLTKSYGLPGLRVGWAASRNRPLLEQARRLRMHFNTYLPAPSEFLACLALSHAGNILQRNRAIATANLDRLRTFLTQYARFFSCHLPTAGVIAYPRWLGPDTTQALSDHLLRSKQLLLAPSECFDAGDRHVRIGFGTSAFPAALQLLAGYLDSRA